MDSPSDPNPTAAVSTTATSTSTSSRVCRGWNDLGHDLLLSILPRISPLDLVAGVYAVCSSWRAVARDPICWRSVDLSDWEAVAARFGADVTFAQVVKRIVRSPMVGPVSRDCTSLALLLVRISSSFQRAMDVIAQYKTKRNLQTNSEQVSCYISEQIGALFSEHNSYKQIFSQIIASQGEGSRLPNLTYLSLPIPEILENEFSIALPRFKYLTGLAVDQYYGFSFSLLYLLEENFPNLAEFKLFDLEERLERNEAMLICHHLPNLRKLELPIRILRQAVLAFLEHLHGLEYLVISGYQNSVINKEILPKASRLKVFIWHSGQELGEFVACRNCGGNEGIPPCQCAVVEKMMEWLARP